MPQQDVKSADKVPRVPGKYYKSSVWSNTLKVKCMQIQQNEII